MGFVPMTIRLRLSATALQFLNYAATSCLSSCFTKTPPIAERHHAGFSFALPVKSIFGELPTKRPGFHFEMSQSARSHSSRATARRARHMLLTLQFQLSKKAIYISKFPSNSPFEPGLLTTEIAVLMRYFSTLERYYFHAEFKIRCYRAISCYSLPTLLYFTGAISSNR